MLILSGASFGGFKLDPNSDAPSVVVGPEDFLKVDSIETVRSVTWI